MAGFPVCNSMPGPGFVYGGVTLVLESSGEALLSLHICNDEPPGGGIAGERIT